MRELPKRIRDYLREQEACCKPSTVASYSLTLACFYHHLKRSTKDPIASLTKSRLQDYLVHLCERDLAPYTKVNYLLSVKKYLRWEVERGKLSGDLLSVLDRSKLPPVPEYLPRPLSAENDRHLQTILRESESPQAPLFLLLRQTGLRISELINLPPDCVTATLKNEKYLKVPLGKMNNERLVPLTDETLALIDRIRSLFKEGSDPNRLIGLPGPTPKVYYRLNRIFRGLTGPLIDQGMPVTFHRLRHSYATSLLNGGVGLVSLMKLLGHRRIDMTLRYAKVTPAHLRNEYLKAIRILENQAAPFTKTSGDMAGHCHPSEILTQLGSFLGTSALMPPKNKKNLLLRLSRLQSTIAQTSFSKHFTLRVP